MPIIKKATFKAVSTASTSSKKSVVDRISGISFDKSEGIKINLYGKSGSGKTTLAASFPKPILFMICSGGNKAGELRSIDTPENVGKISQVVINDTNDVQELVDYQRETKKFATIILDHCTGFQDLKLKEILGLEEIPVQKSWGLATQNQYGQCTVQCKEYFRNLLGLSCNIVLVAQERDFNNDNNSEMILPFVASGLVPSLCGWLNSSVDYIGQTFIRQKEIVKQVTIGTGKVAKMQEMRTKVKGQVEYCLRTAPDPVYTTKFRIPKGRKLPECIIDPSYEKIIAVIKGEYE